MQQFKLKDGERAQLVPGKTTDDSAVACVLTGPNGEDQALVIPAARAMELLRDLIEARLTLIAMLPQPPEDDDTDLLLQADAEPSREQGFVRLALVTRNLGRIDMRTRDNVARALAGSALEAANRVRRGDLRAPRSS